MTRDEVQALWSAITKKADNAAIAASNDHQDLAALHRLDGRCDGLRDAAEMLREALAKSLTQRGCANCEHMPHDGHRCSVIVAGTSMYCACGNGPRVTP